MTAQFSAMRALVQSVLLQSEHYEWSIQGFGMLRTYLDSSKKYRLNIWDSELAVPGVSVIHDHPWDFTSWVIAGKFTNTRFLQGTSLLLRPYDWMVIKTGEGGGPDGATGETGLHALPPEHYRTGDEYRQTASEIHASSYADGTVTLNDRVRREDGEHARTFWPHGQAWVDAEPRIARRSEVYRAVNRALAWWDLA